MSKYDFKNQKVNSFINSLAYSSFISKDFVAELCAIFSTGIGFGYNTRNAKDDEKEILRKVEKTFFEEVKIDIERISIFTEKFKIEILDCLAILIWPEEETKS